jgi:hypothetical protein
VLEVIKLTLVNSITSSGRRRELERNEKKGEKKCGGFLNPTTQCENHMIIY